MTARDVSTSSHGTTARLTARRHDAAAIVLLVLGALLGLAAVVVGMHASAEPDVETGATPTSAWSPADVDLERYADDLLAASAEAHTAAGLPPWEPADCARPVAAERAQALVGAELEHAPLDPVLAACAPLTTAAENLVRAAAPAPDVVEAWMGSPGHRANLEDPTLTQAATSCVWDDDEVLCTLLLAGP